MKVVYEMNRANIYNTMNPVIYGRGVKPIV